MVGLCDRPFEVLERPLGRSESKHEFRSLLLDHSNVVHDRLVTRLKMKGLKRGGVERMLASLFSCGNHVRGEEKKMLHRLCVFERGVHCRRGLFLGCFGVPRSTETHKYRHILTVVKLDGSSLILPTKGQRTNSLGRRDYARFRWHGQTRHVHNSSDPCLRTRSHR